MHHNTTLIEASARGRIAGLRRGARPRAGRTGPLRRRTGLLLVNLGLRLAL